jgi:hypothetical protein
MRNQRILLVSALSLFVVAQVALSQRGGAARSGVRGAVVGGMVGGSEGAETGAKVGVITGATRNAIERETVSRAQYQTTPDYQTVPHANFTETPPDVLGSTTTGMAAKPGVEAVIRKDGKPLMGVTFPADWIQKTGGHYISAVSKDAHAYSMFATLEGTDKQAGIKKIKGGLEGYLKDMKFDEPVETKGGAMVITGTGKAKKAGVDVVFAAAVFEADKGHLVGAAFVVDSKIEDHYKETVRGICQTLRRAQDFKDGK